MAKTAKPTQKASAKVAGAKTVGAKAAGHAVSPLAPKSFPKLPPLAGVRLGTAAAGIRYKQVLRILGKLPTVAAFCYRHRIGRPFNYAAALGGEAGVAHVINLLRAEIDRNMAMLGACSCSEIGAHNLA